MFDRFFSSDNVLWTAMGKIFDLFILNTLLILCSIPLFTIGPAVTGFYYALINVVRDEEISVSQEFFRSFRQNFRQGIKMGIPYTLLLLFLYTDVRLSHASGTGIYSFFMVFFFILLIAAFCVGLYAFPILAKFEKTTRDIWFMAFTLSIKHFGTTAAMLFAAALGAWITHLLPGLLFLIFGLEGLFQASMLVRIFAPWLPAQRKTVSDPLEQTEDNL